MRNWLIFGGLAAAVAVGVAVWVWFSPGEPVQAARVSRGPVAEFVDEQGKTRLPRTYLVTMPYAGRIEEIALPEGAAVEAGQVVARISPRDLENELAEAQAAVDRLTAAIAENEDVSVEEGGRQQAQRFVESMLSTVAAAEARMTAGQRRMEYAESYLAKTRRLADTGARTADDVDQADVAFVTSSVDYQQDRLIWEAMKSILAATELLPTMIGDYISRKDLTGAVLEQERSEAQARLRQAQLRQERSEMRSPVAGVVLARRVVNEQFLAAGETLLEIGRPEELEVEADILSQDVVRVQVGDPVEIYGPAVGGGPGAGLRGTVRRIFPAGFTKISSLGVEQQRVKVIVGFEAPPAAAPGQTALGVDFQVRVRITTDSRADALTAPRSAVFRGPDGGWQCFVVRGGRAVLQPIELGLANDDAVEITQGVQEGELVILAPESSLTPGTKVSPAVRE